MKYKNKEDIFRSVIDNLHEGILITDAENKVIYVNEAYTRITGVAAEDILHTDLAVSRPGSRMNAVLASGKAELGVHRSYGNREHITNIMPIIQNGTVLGGASILNSVDDIHRLSKDLEKKERELKSLQQRIDKIRFTKFSFDNIVAVNAGTQETKELALKLASKDISILIQGESGTGKEVFAQAIHDASPRRSYPFVAINCSTLNPSLIESELFGYTGGAFTGANKTGQKGIFEAAEGGTIFLDEIGEMDLRLQAKLLRVLQEGAIRPVGSVNERKINVRIIAATNRNLLQMVSEEKFRLDLYYRIAPAILTLLPLSKRKEDILPLAEGMLEKEGRRNKKNLSLSEDAKKLLTTYSWPGNVRELSNVINVAAILCERDTITAEDFPTAIRESLEQPDVGFELTLQERVRQVERAAILRVLQKYGVTTAGKKQAAKALGISVATLYNKLKTIEEPQK